jgi:hypothetical protein
MLIISYFSIAIAPCAEDNDDNNVDIAKNHKQKYLVNVGMLFSFQNCPSVIHNKNHNFSSSSSSLPPLTRNNINHNYNNHNDSILMRMQHRTLQNSGRVVGGNVASSGKYRSFSGDLGACGAILINKNNA